MSKKDQDIFFEQQFDHSKAKLSLLKNYAVKWMRKVTLGSPIKKCAIMDTFAGTGYYDDGSEGSPIILTKAAIDYCIQASSENRINFDEIILVFVEKNKDNFVKLKENLENFTNQKIDSDQYIKLEKYPKVVICITNDDFENFIDDLLDNVDMLIPTLMFIDPFGYKAINYRCISNIIEKYDYCELLINFMYEEFNRFLLKADSGKFIDTQCNFYGPNLSDVKLMIRGKNPKDRRSIIIDGYKENLKKIGAKYTLDFDIEKKGKIKMNIIFCTKNIYGFDTMKESMQSICDSTDFEYHTKNPQLSIFDIDNEEKIICSLANYIVARYHGKSVPVEIIKRYSMEHPFIPSKYLKRALKELENNNMILSVKRQSGTQRRKGTFPDGSIIEFKDGDIDV